MYLFHTGTVHCIKRIYLNQIDQNTLSMKLYRVHLTPFERMKNAEINLIPQWNILFCIRIFWFLCVLVGLSIYHELSHFLFQSLSLFHFSLNVAVRLIKVKIRYRSEYYGIAVFYIKLLKWWVLNPEHLTFLLVFLCVTTQTKSLFSALCFYTNIQCNRFFSHGPSAFEIQTTQLDG